MVITILSSTMLIVAILLFRLLFRRRVKAGIIYAMWGLAALRLLIPVPLIAAPSIFSAEYVYESSGVDESITDSQAEDAGKAPQGELAADENAWETEYDTLMESDYLYEPDTNITHRAVEKNSEDSILYKYNYQTDFSEGVPGTDTNQEKQSQGAEASGNQPGDSGNDGSGSGYDSGSGRFVINAAAIRFVKAVWLSVAALFFLAIVISNGIMYRRLKRSRAGISRENQLYVYKSELVPVPCLYGLFRPAIYITPEVAAEPKEERRYIICHEQMHYRHLDYVWSALRIVLVCVYWFNPLVWVAAKMSRRDAEYAADDAVIRSLGEEERVNYGESILRTLRSKQTKGGILSMASTACSSKQEIKKRLMFISQTKKYSAVSLTLMIIAAAAVTVCSFAGRAAERSEGDVMAENAGTDTVEDLETGIKLPGKLDEAVQQIVRDRANVTDSVETIMTESYVPLVVEEEGNRTTVYLIALAAAYGMQDGFGFTDNWIEFQAGAATFEKKGKEYINVGYQRTPGDTTAETVISQMQEMFPNVSDEKIKAANWSNLLTARCHTQAMWQLMKQKERVGNAKTHITIGGAEMVSIYAGDSYVGEYGLAYDDNKDFVNKLVAAYNQVELQTIAEEDDVSMEFSSAITICYWSEWKKFVQITFDRNGVCWVDGEPFTYKMKKNVFDYDEILKFVRTQGRKQFMYHPMIASELPDIVEYDNDMKLLEQCLDKSSTIDGALIKKRAELLSEREGLPFEDEYVTQRDMFVQLKRNRLAASKHEVAPARKDCSLKGVREGIAGTEEVSLEPYCENRGITQEQYWEYMEKATMLLFPYEEYERKIFEEDEEFQKEFKGQYKKFSDAAGLMEEYYKPQIDKMIRSIPVRVIAPELGISLDNKEIDSLKLEDAVSEAIEEDMGMTAAATSSNQYVTAKKWRIVESHVTLLAEKEDDLIKVYLIRKAVCYGIKKKKWGFEELGDKRGFCILTFVEKNGNYELSNWWEGKDKEELRRYFPVEVLDAQLNEAMYQEVLDEECKRQAEWLRE